ncbi:hypothetical protein SESBI_03652 [Sesbania bispinosa]|nr:hypothetical protein SESBI_03652 [Sesbania bispinosa]
MNKFTKFPPSVFVDKERNRILLAEAGKDFIDVLLSFLTLPLGTIARLIAKETNMQPVSVGSLSSLYKSVLDLDEEYLWTHTCKEMLLQPRNSMEAYCQSLKLNIDDTEPIQYFICEDLNCCMRLSGSCLSSFRNKKCYCGKLLNKVTSPENLTTENGFVKETTKFIISDDLNVMPNIFGATVLLFQKLGVHDFDAIENQTVEISKNEAYLLKLSLLSKTPLTDFILKKKQFLDHCNPRNESLFVFGELPSDEGRQMVVKVLTRKSNGKILLAEAEEDLVNFLFNFLTFPLGGVLNMLQGVSYLRCIDNFYKSVTELSSERYLRSQGLKDKLAKPQCAPQFGLSNQLLPIGVASLPFDLMPCIRYVPLKFVDPKFSMGECSSSRGFARGPSTYMVTDDLVVTPMSSISGISYLSRSRVRLVDLEERIISISMEEGLSILKASLTSTSALTNGLNQFTRTIKEEK